MSIRKIIDEHIMDCRALLAMEAAIETAAEKIYGTLSEGRRVFICGNGGSAADSQHMACEFVGRFKKERRPYPVIALTTDTSILTAVANDYSFEDIFSRQVHALASQGDILIAISTSGRSKNVVKAIQTARSLNVYTIGLTGKSGETVAQCADICLKVPTDDTPRVQECHTLIIHIMSQIIESRLHV